MAKKIKLKREPTEDEKKAEAEKKALESEGIQDEFQAKGFELVEWMQDNSGIVLGLIGIILVAGLAVGVVQFSSSSKNADASALFAEAKTIYDAPLGDAPAGLTGGDKEGPTFKDAKERAEKARAAFEKVTSEYGSTGVANLARLYVGNTALSLEDYDGAIQAYEAYLAASSRDDTLRFLALDGLATALDAKGDRAKALARLDELVALPSKANRDVALIRIARLAMASGDNAKARQAAERVVSDFPESPAKAQADEILSSLPSGS